MSAQGQTPNVQVNYGHQNPVHYQHPSPGEPVVYKHQQQQLQPGFNLTVDSTYLKSQSGILKFIEMVVLLLAFATALKFKEIYDVQQNKTQIYADEKLEFFLGAAISGWVMCILIVFAFLFGLNKSCGVPTNPIVLVALFHMAWIIMLGGGSGALAYRAHQYLDAFRERGIALGQLREPLKTQINCLFVAVVSGFLAVIVFIIDVILQCKVYTPMKTHLIQIPITVMATA